MTPVQKIEVKGFRSLRDVAWEPDRLNVIIGANGSGKSNLLRALEMLRQSAAGKLRDAVLSEGGFRQLLWDHRAPEMSWTLKLPLGPNADPDRVMTYDLALQSSSLLLGGEFQVAKELLTDSGQRDLTKANKPLHVIERDADHAVISDANEQEIVAPRDTVPRDGTILSGVNLFTDFRIFLFRTILLSFGIYHDLVTHQGAPVGEAAVARVEKLLSPDGSNLVPMMHTLYSEHRDFKKAVDAGMCAAFGVDFEDLVFGPAADQRVQLGIRWPN
jgi:predicted ATPase